MMFIISFAVNYSKITNSMSYHDIPISLFGDKKHLLIISRVTSLLLAAFSFNKFQSLVFIKMHTEMVKNVVVVSSFFVFNENMSHSCFLLLS